MKLGDVTLDILNFISILGVEVDSKLSFEHHWKSGTLDLLEGGALASSTAPF